MAIEELNKLISEKVPTVEALEGRFLFINDDTLRSNIAIAFQYIIFLITLDEESELQGPITYSIYKNIILHTATIIESCVHYCLKEYINNDKIDDIVEIKKEYSKPKKLYELDADIALYMCVKKNINLKLKNTTEFYKINKMAKRNKILTKSLFEDAEKIRENRNKIHLSALTKKDKYFSKSDVDDTFKKARGIIEQIEKKIKAIV